ncbi:MAG TPA: BsuBI/PstI family type II restriction endonuclease [Anaerolineae bacterium]|nr:BsuBI/PstI family type II restriction endonuclease [Anaerolineae bacterium]
MALQDSMIQIKDRVLPDQLQGISKDRIRATLRAIDRESDDMVDAVFALLDDITPSLFPKAQLDARFCDGASTQHIAAHVGMWQRGGARLDREGRDYWIKPLRDIGAIEPVYLKPDVGVFILGHPVPKSPNSAYRLAASFREVLTAPESEWEPRLQAWIQEDTVRARLQRQAELSQLARSAVDTKHSDLVQACQMFYAPAFLPGFQVVYVDDADGDRVSEAQRAALTQAGISLTLADAMPDILLWNAETNWLWVIEAVASDGEVDLHKVQQLSELARRSGKPGIGFTTAYQTWKAAAARQSRYKNLPPGTHLWIMEDPTKQFHALEAISLPGTKV